MVERQGAGRADPLDDGAGRPVPDLSRSEVVHGARHTDGEDVVVDGRGGGQRVRVDRAFRVVLPRDEERYLRDPVGDDLDELGRGARSTAERVAPAPLDLAGGSATTPATGPYAEPVRVAQPRGAL